MKAAIYLVWFSACFITTYNHTEKICLLLYNEMISSLQWKQVAEPWLERFVRLEHEKGVSVWIPGSDTDANDRAWLWWWWSLNHPALDIPRAPGRLGAQTPATPSLSRRGSRAGIFCPAQDKHRDVTRISFTRTGSIRPPRNHSGGPTHATAGELFIFSPPPTPPAALSNSVGVQPGTLAYGLGGLGQFI